LDNSRHNHPINLKNILFSLIGLFGVDHGSEQDFLVDHCNTTGIDKFQYIVCGYHSVSYFLWQKNCTLAVVNVSILTSEILNYMSAMTIVWFVLMYRSYSTLRSLGVGLVISYCVVLVCISWFRCRHVSRLVYRWYTVVTSYYLWIVHGYNTLTLHGALSMHFSNSTQLYGIHLAPLNSTRFTHTHTHTHIVNNCVPYLRANQSIGMISKLDPVSTLCCMSCKSFVSNSPK